MGATKGTIFDESKDIPASMLDGFIRKSFKDIRKDVLSRKHLTIKELAFFECEVRTFTNNFKGVLASKDRRQREVALRALLSALWISYYHGGGSQIRREFQKDRTEPAHRAWDEIETIIEGHARELWTRKPLFKTTHLGTAKEIWEDVAADIRKLGKLPSRWNPDKLHRAKALNDAATIEIEKNKFIGKIRRRVSKITR